MRNTLSLGFEALPSAVEIGHVTFAPLYHDECLTNTYICSQQNHYSQYFHKSNFPVTHPKLKQMYEENAHQISKLDTPLMFWNQATITASMPSTQQQKKIDKRSNQKRIAKKKHASKMSGSCPSKYDREMLLLNFEIQRKYNITFPKIRPQ